MSGLCFRRIQGGEGIEIKQIGQESENQSSGYLCDFNNNILVTLLYVGISYNKKEKETPLNLWVWGRDGPLRKVSAPG